MSSDIREYADTNDMAECLGIHQTSVIRLINQGKIPAKKVFGKYLISREKLHEFADGYSPERDHSPPHGFVNPPELARILGISSNAVRKLINACRIDAEQIGREWYISWEEVERFSAIYRKGQSWENYEVVA